jgi:quinol-cytochrome oxidoreductase complex cytochrome b subunit
MRYVKIFIFIIYFIVYGYSCHKASVTPDENIWGYICTIVFAYLFIFIVKAVIEHDSKKKKESENSNEI